MRIRSSLAYPIVGFVVLSVLVTAMTLHFWANHVMTENLRATDWDHAAKHHEFISEYIRNNSRTILRLARIYKTYGSVIDQTGLFFENGGFETHTGHLPLKKIIESLGISEHMDEILITDLAGRVIARAKSDQAGDALQGWGIEEAAQGQDMLLTTHTDSGWEIRALSPIRNQEKIIGIIVITRRIDDLFARGLSRLFDCKASFGKPEGIVASALPPDDRITIDRGLILRVLREKKTEWKDYERFSKTVYYARLNIVDEAFCLIVEKDTSKSKILVAHNRKATLLLSMIILIVISSMGLAFSLRLTRPLQQLKRTSQKIAKEFANEDLKDIPGNEVDNLVYVFNSMERAIRGHIARRQAVEEELEHHRLRLEDLVTQRTANLNRANESLKAEITERVKTEKMIRDNKARLEDTLSELKMTQAKMIQSEKMASVGQLAAGVAHEINNPAGYVNSNLNTLVGYQEDIAALIGVYCELKKMLIDNAKTSDLSQQVDNIVHMESEVDLDYLMEDIPVLIRESLEGIERIRSIVAALKDFAHPGEQKTGSADINQCLESTLKMVWNELKYKATVTTEYGSLPPVTCNVQQINQAFVNILVNAAQAIEDQGEIDISTRTNGDDVVVRISDTGKGISSGDIKSIFDPFFTTKEIGKGTGLGLNIVWDIIQAQGGRIEVESEEGNGTTFTLFLKADPETLKADDE